MFCVLHWFCTRQLRNVLTGLDGIKGRHFILFGGASSYTAKLPYVGTFH